MALILVPRKSRPRAGKIIIPDALVRFVVGAAEVGSDLDREFERTPYTHYVERLVAPDDEGDTNWRLNIYFLVPPEDEVGCDATAAAFWPEQ
jgi:hypothetical protein